MITVTFEETTDVEEDMSRMANLFALAGAWSGDERLRLRIVTTKDDVIELDLPPVRPDFLQHLDDLSELRARYVVHKE